MYITSLFFLADWKIQWSLQAEDKCSKFKTILCFGCSAALTWRKSEELKLNYLDLSHLSRPKNYIGSLHRAVILVFHVNRRQDFCYTGKLEICTSSGVWSLRSLAALSSSTWNMQPMSASQQRPWQFSWAPVSAGGKMLYIIKSALISHLLLVQEEGSFNKCSR